VKGAGPGDARRRGCREGVPENALNAALHLRGGASREGQKQNALRVGAAHYEMSHAMGEGVGLARARSGNDQQRAADVRAMTDNAMLDGATLLAIEVVEIVGSGHDWT